MEPGSSPQQSIEPRTSVEERAYRFLWWLTQRPEKEVVISGHGGFFDTVLNSDQHIYASANARHRMKNCELRTFTLMWSIDDTVPGAKPLFKLEA